MNSTATWLETIGPRIDFELFVKSAVSRRAWITTLQELRTSTPVSLAVSDLFVLPAFVEAPATDVPLPFLYAIDPVSSFPQAT